LTRFLPIALVLGLVTGGLGATLDALPAAAGTTTSVSFTPLSYVAGATTTWTVGLTTATGTLVAGDTIYVEFPAGFAIPTPAVTLGPAFATAHCTYSSASTTGEVVAIVLANSGGTCSIVVGTALTLEIAGVTNGAAGPYDGSAFAAGSTFDTYTSPTPTGSTYLTLTTATTGGTMTVYPTSVITGSTGNTLTFTYTAPVGGLSSGSTIDIFVPGDWLAPSTIVTAGYTTSTCGSVAVVGQEIEVTTVALTGGETCTITYEDATAPPSAETSTFTTYVNSIELASSPQVTVSSTGVITPPNTVSGVTFSGSSMSGGATNTTWTVGFTTSDPHGALGPGYAIYVTFPAGFVIPSNPAVTLGSGFYGCTATPQATAVTSGQTVTITLGAGCELAASTYATLSIAGITNPAAGSYANTSFAVSTSVDFAASPAAAVVITGATVPTVPTVPSTCAGSTGNAAFLCSAYEHLLGRAPDAGGLASFEGLLAAGVSRAQVAYDIATSPEYRSNLVGFWYQLLLGRPADPGGLATWIGLLNAGWSDQAVLEGIMGSPEFYTHAGGTPSGFVMALYTDLLRRGADSGGLASWVGKVNAGVSRGTVVAGFLYSNEYETNFVESEYANLLGRVADPGGLATWLSALRGGFSYEWVIADIMGSAEFYADSQ
jgi:hypothetical protein